MYSTIQKLFYTVILSAALTACGDAAKEGKTEEAKEEMPTADKEKTKKFEGIAFASDKDTICGMPLTAGIEDTMMVDGKVYGFCATGCKEEFAKMLSENKQ